MIKLITLVISAILLLVPAVASTLGNIPNNSTDFIGALENGGQSMAFLVAMYWLKDSHQRRVNDAKEFANEIKELKQSHREEIQRVQEVQKGELIHCQDQLANMTNRLFEWIKSTND